MKNKMYKRWKELGSWGMLIITEFDIYLVLEGYKDEFGNWDLIKDSIRIMNRPKRNYAMDMRSSEHMMNSALEDIETISVSVNIQTKEAVSDFLYRFCINTSHWQNIVIPKCDIQYTIPLCYDQIEEIVNVLERENGRAIAESVLDITQFHWNINRLV